MKIYKSLIAGLLLLPCCAAMEIWPVESGTSTTVLQNIQNCENIVEYFKQNADDYKWLPDEYKTLFSELPSISTFQKKWREYIEKLTLENKGSIIDVLKKCCEIKEQVRQFFQKYLNIDKNLIKKKLHQKGKDDKLEHNEAFYVIADRVIVKGSFNRVSSFYETGRTQISAYLEDSSIFPCIDTLNRNCSEEFIKDKLRNILYRYIEDFICEWEYIEELKTSRTCEVYKPKICKSEIRNKYKNELSNFIKEYIGQDPLEQPIDNIADDILKEIDENCLSLNKGLTKDQIKQFTNSYRMNVSYLGNSSLLTSIVHEIGHAIDIANILSKDINHLARQKNKEAVAIYFEILLKEDDKYKDYKYLKIDRLDSLYRDFASILSMGILSKEINIKDIKNILNLRDLSPDKQEKYAKNHRKVCEKAFDIFKTVYKKIFPKIEGHELNWMKNDIDSAELTDGELAFKLSCAYRSDNFIIDNDSNKIKFQFELHNENLFHVFRIKKQAEKERWNLEKTLQELACQKIEIPTPREFKEVIDWMLSN